MNLSSRIRAVRRKMPDPINGTRNRGAPQKIRPRPEQAGEAVIELATKRSVNEQHLNHISPQAQEFCAIEICASETAIDLVPC